MAYKEILMNRSNKLSLILIGILASNSLRASLIPRITIIIVVDQFAYDYIQKIEPHLRGGLRHLLHHGIVYKNAYYPHGTPTTAPGHAGLNTGAYPSYHGMIGNNWWDFAGNKIGADDDSADRAAVFAPNGQLYDYGKSPHFMMADGISDQFMLSQNGCQERYVYSLSLKSRSSIMTAGYLGKAVWFDENSGNFTSSKAYFDQLPAWLDRFNSRAWHKSLCSISWKLMFHPKSCAYAFHDPASYTYASRTNALAGKTIAMSSKENEPYDLFMRTPQANELLFDLAQSCIDAHVHYCGNEQLLLWLCLSPLDKVGHEYGPDSREALDMLYHLDCQLEEFMHCITKRLKRRDFLFVLTADHGISMISELMRERGFGGAQRISVTTVIEDLNTISHTHYGLKDLVVAFQNGQFYLNRDHLHSLEVKKQRGLLKHFKHYLNATGLFKHVWTDSELEHGCFEPNSYESFFQHQYFRGRSGNIIVQPLPNKPLIEYHNGATHRTPYEPDTHVPLILYQKSYHEKRVVFDKVWTLQLANTLAHILHIPQPSASPFAILPGIIEYDPITGEAVQPVVL